jgi:hypothetical protein
VAAAIISPIGVSTSESHAIVGVSALTLLTIEFRWSDDGKRAVRFDRKLDDDGIAGAYDAPGEHDTHDTSATNDFARVVATRHLGEQPGLKSVDLHTGVSEPCDLNDRFFANAKPRAEWKFEECEAARGEVLTELPGLNQKTVGLELVRQFVVDEVDLPKIRLRRVARHA